MVLLRHLQTSRASTNCRSATLTNVTLLRRSALRQLRPQVARYATKLSKDTKVVKTVPTPAANEVVSKKPIYPARLLVYHAGTPRTVFIGCMKVTTIFLAAFFGLIVAPAQLAAPTLPYWRFATTLATGIMPLLFVTWTTAPFVTYIHLRLPQFARLSRDLLVRYLRTLPKTGEVDITTITLIGRPRVQRLQFGDLQAQQPRLLNVANFKTERIDTTRPWWALGQGQRQYAIGEAKGKARDGWCWDVVAAAIREGKLKDAPSAAAKSTVAGTTASAAKKVGKK